MDLQPAHTQIATGKRSIAAAIISSIRCRYHHRHHSREASQSALSYNAFEAKVLRVTWGLMMERCLAFHEPLGHQKSPSTPTMQIAANWSVCLNVQFTCGSILCTCNLRSPSLFDALHCCCPPCFSSTSRARLHPQSLKRKFQKSTGTNVQLFCQQKSGTLHNILTKTAFLLHRIACLTSGRPPIPSSR